MKNWRTVAILLLCLALAGSVACGGDGQEEAGQQLVEVKRGDLVISVSGSGSISVSDEATLTFGTNGIVDKIYVDENDTVTKDDILAELDTAPLELTLLQAQIALDQAGYGLNQAEYGLEQAEYQRDEAELYRDFTEVRHSIDMVSEETLDLAEDALRIAEEGITIAEEGVRIAERQIQAAEQTVNEAQKKLDRATITAPFSGVVVSVDVDEGDTISTATTIIHLIDPSSMELKADVDEIDVAEVKPGQRVIIEIDALPAFQLEGEVTFISSLAEEEAGVVLYEVKIDFAIPEGSGLRAGMSATADIIINERNDVLLIPARAVEEDDEGNSVVKVMVNEEIEERPVVIGISDDYQTEIVKGLDEGEVVVIGKRAK